MLTLLSLAIAITLLVEVPIVAAFYPAQRLRMAIACALTTTAVTLAINAFSARAGMAHDARIVTGVAAALAFETTVYAFVAGAREGRPWGRAFAASAAANVASYGVGLLFF